MLRKITLIASLVVLVAGLARAQEAWSLQRCIDFARENSLTMKQAENSIRSAELNVKLNQLSRLPNINGNAGAGAQFGRTIDPTTNTFESQTIWYNSFSINGGLQLFNAGGIHHAVAQSKLDLDATKLEADATFNDLALNITSTYLAILLAEEQLENASKQLEQSQAQLDQTDKLIRAGTLPANDRLDVLAQIALNEQNVVQAENSVQTNYLILLQLLELKPTQPFRIEKPEIVLPADANPDQFRSDEVYSAALGTQPQIRANELRQASAEKRISITQTNGLPTLSIGGSLSTSWSSFKTQPVVIGTDVYYIDQNIRLPDGSIATFGLEVEEPILDPNEPFTRADYWTQLDNNFGQSVGLQLSVPIYNASRNSIAVQQARVSALSAKIASDQAKQRLQSDVLNAVTAAKAARRAYVAAEKSFEAASMAYDNAQKRYDLGAINTFELTTAKTNRDAAEIEVTRARFQYLFNLKIVDFYQGRPLKID
ncbi:MAG: TolC family protein [Saprospiraceae bacterium]|nr:TolC family protein [Saprospiraceae bacterium]MCB0625043.1 TolC family protein [Saprospiraceae bacterium]MCB0677488.1 TolC family protein [Saprospiraceae bacterium]MCB0682269.1 TolC family protein [Saprospiraceae bacterium]